MSFSQKYDHIFKESLPYELYPMKYLPTTALLLALATSLLNGRELNLDELFPSDRLLDVQITMTDSDWSKVRYQVRTRETALAANRRTKPGQHPYSYVDATVVIDGVTLSDVGVRKKGFLGSQSTTRPSLKIKLDHKTKGRHIGGLEVLTLNNNRQDTGLISQFMGYGLFNAAGSPASRCAYARVTVNGNDLGIYSHVETVREPLLQREFGSDQGTLYEGTVVDFYPGWEGSFEKKTGKNKPGRRLIGQIIEALQSAPEGDALMASDVFGRGRVPVHGRDGLDWIQPDFDDSTWRSGRGGAGFETGQGYQSLIGDGFDFGSQMHRQQPGLYLRYRFDLPSKNPVLEHPELFLRMKYDDGFVAYLNGFQIASANAPNNPRWNSKATGNHDDSQAKVFQNFVLTEHWERLREGSNVLAIHGLNIDPSSSDMLIAAELMAAQPLVGPSEEGIAALIDLDAFYTFWTMEGLLGWWDGYSANRNNFFVYRHPGSGKLHFLPWGADSMFEWRSRLPVDPNLPYSVFTKGMVAQYLYQIPESRERYARTLRHLFATIWNEKALLAETDRIEALLTPHLHPRQSGFGRALDQRREFIRNRRGKLMAEIADGMPEWPPTPSRR